MSTDNDNMTPEEREQWLRDRGVELETPEDRRKAESILSGTISEEDGTTTTRPQTIVEQIQSLSISSNESSPSDEGIKFVMIPHNTSKPLVQVVLPKQLVNALGAGDIIPTYVKQFFSDGKSIDDSLFKEQASKQQHLVGGDPEKLTSQAIANATADGSVETFPLVRPSSTNKNQGVYIYLDEVGLLKHLPNNQRASKLALQCGFNPAPNFYGDIFVGRVSSVPNLRNIDIETKDIIDTISEWMVRAPQENVAWQQMMNEVTGRQGDSQPSVVGTDGVAAESTDGLYSWLQNDEEIEITVSLTKKIEEGSTVNKSLIKVSFQMQKIIVKYGGETLLELKLYSKLDVDGCTWTLDKENLVVTAEKASEETWPRLELGAL